MNNIVITDLPLNLDESTLTVFVTNDVLIQSQKVTRNFINSNQVRELYDDQLQLLRDSIELIQALMEIVKGEERILNENINLSDSDVQFTAREVSDLRSNYAAEMKQIKERSLSYNVSMRKLMKKIQTISTQQTEEGVQVNKGSASLELNLESSVFGVASVEVAYFDRSAGWTPAYDLRVDGLIQPLNIVYKANIFQNTGEDWEDVAISLSTAIPDNDYSLPVVNPYYLTFNNYYSTPSNKNEKSVNGLIHGRVTDDTGQPLIGASIVVKGTKTGSITDIDGQYQLRIPKGSDYLVVSYVGFQSKEVPIDRKNISLTLEPSQELLSDVVVTGYGGSDQSNMLAGRTKGITVRKSFASIPLSIVKAQTTLNYDISTPLSIPTTTQEKSILIRSELVNVDYKYVAFPKLEKEAYLIAQIKNWEELQIIYGVANIYIDNRYIGQTEIGELQDNELLYSLSLGQDKDDYIERTLQKRYSRKKFVGNNKVELRRWSLKIANNKNEKVSLTIEDQFPISKLGDIKVDLKESSGAQVKEDLGSLEWSLEMEPYGNQELIFEYEVKSPRDRNLIVE